VGRKQAARIVAFLTAALIGAIGWFGAYDNLLPLAPSSAAAHDSATFGPQPPARSERLPLPTPQPTATPLPTTTGYLTEVYTDPSGNSMTYYVHVPSDYNPRAQARYPIVLLLHGVGEDAHPTFTPEQNRNAILSHPYVQAWTSAAIQAQWPSFVVVPQIMAPNRWVDVPGPQGDYSLAPQPTESLAMANAILTLVERTYTRIDGRRVYITGISMGAYGVWDAIERWPQEFAAAAPVAGGGSLAGAAQLIHLPLWAFHRANDTSVPVAASRDMIAAIKSAGGAPCYTEVPGTDHDIWMIVYGESSFMQWLFAQGTATAALGAIPVCAAPPIQ
jgi:predicted peptidase